MAAKQSLYSVQIPVRHAWQNSLSFAKGKNCNAGASLKVADVRENLNRGLVLEVPGVLRCSDSTGKLVQRLGQR